MQRMLTKRSFIAAVLIIAGTVLTIVYGIRSVRSYQQVQYARQQGLDDGTAGVEAIRPWMTMQYVSVAYGVPVEYLFAELEIPLERRNVNQTIGDLNREYDFGRPEPIEDDEQGGFQDPPLTGLVQEAITSYLANPVATGLRDIRPWMTIRYIANSSGVPEAFLLEALNITDDGNHLFLPLDELAEEIRFNGGPRELGEIITAVLDAYEEGE